MFPSGGYNLKTGAGSKIELMKYDMGGAAAVLGAAKALGEIRPFGVEVSPSFIIHHSRMYLLGSACIQLSCMLRCYVAGAFHCCSL